MSNNSIEKIKSNTAVAALACGILGWLLIGALFLFVSFLNDHLISDTIVITVVPGLWVAAIILGAISLLRLKSNPSLKGRIMAIAGIILGAIPFVSLLIYIIAIVVGFVDFLTHPYYG